MSLTSFTTEAQARAKWENGCYPFQQVQAASASSKKNNKLTIMFREKTSEVYYNNMPVPAEGPVGRYTQNLVSSLVTVLKAHNRMKYLPELTITEGSFGKTVFQLQPSDDYFVEANDPNKARSAGYPKIMGKKLHADIVKTYWDSSPCAHVYFQKMLNPAVGREPFVIPTFDLPSDHPRVAAAHLELEDWLQRCELGSDEGAGAGAGAGEGPPVRPEGKGHNKKPTKIEMRLDSVVRGPTLPLCDDDASCNSNFRVPTTRLFELVSPPPDSPK